MNIFDLTTHQLDVIRTGASVLGAIGGFFGGIGAVYAIIARNWARKAAHNTSTETWVGGKLRATPVSELARHAATTGEATRQEISDLGEWVRGPGRRRLPTTEITPLTRQESTYE